MRTLDFFLSPIKDPIPDVRYEFQKKTGFNGNAQILITIYHGAAELAPVAQHVLSVDQASQIVNALLCEIQRNLFSDL